MIKHRYKLIVLSNPVEGRTADFNEWYSKTHVKDMLAIPGIVSAERFELAEFQRLDTPQPYRFLAVYDIETHDLKGVTDEMRRRSGTAELVVSDAIDKGLLLAFFSPLSMGSDRPFADR